MISSKKPYPRNKRIADNIKTILGNIFLNKNILHSKGLLTITKVIVTQDLRLAKIYITFMENDLKSKNVIDELEINKKYIRFLLGKSLSSKYVPEIMFFYDETTNNALMINSLLNKIQGNE